jgi:predicted RNA binding protein with dsRBD fold (UPF0201 family)
MNAQLRTLAKQCRVVRRIDDEIADVTRPGRPPEARRLASLLKLRRIADSAARAMAEAIGPTAEDFYRNHHAATKGRVA